jgi:hypothetical protein
MKVRKEIFLPQKKITSNENSINSNQIFVIEIDDDDENDLEILYSRYP